LNSKQRNHYLFQKAQIGQEITVLRFFFKKKNEKNKPEFKKKEGRNPHIITATNQHSAKKCLKFRGTSPPQRKKVPSIFEFPPAKPLPFSKSPKQRKNYRSPFFFQKKTKKTSPKKKYKKGPDAFTDAYRSVLKSPYKKKNFLLVRTIFDFFRFLDASRIADHLENAARNAYGWVYVHRENPPLLSG
jgi:hypothetical protein